MTLTKETILSTPVGRELDSIPSAEELRQKADAVYQVPANIIEALESSAAAGHLDISITLFADAARIRQRLEGRGYTCTAHATGAMTILEVSWAKVQ